MTAESLSGRKVMMVEDEAIVALMLEDMLQEIGCKVSDSAASLGQAMVLAETTEADVAILDINLNGAEVYPAAERLVERRIPLIFATGYGKKILPPRWSGTPVLGKPVTVSDLERALQSVLET